ncbi:MAG TPA: 30S ribosomal protein S13, partial [Thiomicrospira sp.]|nr:30S ribosomal protein S13 [Thiomicrospira sp.]
MARIAGVNIPVNKHIVIGLTSIYGVGSTSAQKICDAAKLDPTTKVRELTEEQLEAL